MAVQDWAVAGQYVGIYLLAVLCAAIGGHLFVRLVLKPYRLPGGGLTGAGARIGYLERIFVLTLVILGQYGAIALVFTAKSIARFNELKEREFAEYYLIGTLASILISLLIGVLARSLLRGTLAEGIGSI